MRPYEVAVDAFGTYAGRGGEIKAGAGAGAGVCAGAVAVDTAGTEAVAETVR